MNSTVRIVLAAAAVVTAALLGYNYLVAPNVGLPASSFAPSSTPTPRSEASPSMLPELRIPTYGALGNTEPKDYGWTGAAGSSADMHNVDLHAEMVFAVESHQLDCFARGEGPEPVPTTVAGFEGLYVEPYGDDPRARFEPGDPVTTGAYALAIGDRTLCVYLSWGPEASPAQRATAREVLDSLRAQPFGVDGVRIVFTTLGWDNG